MKQEMFALALGDCGELGEFAQPSCVACSTGISCYVEEMV